MKIRIKKNDIVQVISGDDKGKTGRVLLIDPKKLTVLIEGVNIHIKHEKPSQSNQKGGRVEKEFPVHYSNVLLVDSDKNPTRIGIRKEQKGNDTVTVRYSRSNNKVI
ncbi:MAG: 50S ribosomal protein L24 [Candidatus Kapabacteria bacterium]|jgi:large subunit ribosomal protein L24|nr:50S ribosomal protein L24 [Candidatus Kapabacteria bacterium]